jgi:hypothetical protein
MRAIMSFLKTKNANLHRELFAWQKQDFFSQIEEFPDVCASSERKTILLILFVITVNLLSSLALEVCSLGMKTSDSAQL